MNTIIYNTQGKQEGSIELPESVFGLPANEALVYQVAIAMQANARTKAAHVKDRGEVRGGGRKPWQQKGTGRARHGSIRSPIWRGGGITHGPRNERDYTQKVNKKMATKALCTALSEKFRAGDVVFVSVDMKAPKTKDAKVILGVLAKTIDASALMKKSKNSFGVMLGEKNDTVAKSFRNFRNVNLESVAAMNVLDVLSASKIVFTAPEAAIKTLSARVAKK